MPADPITYCLEKLTDYTAFERLCHELMRFEGYSGLEPLGGFKDKGRDAVHTCRGNSALTTVFAYSVREDWQRKLDEDAVKVRKHSHVCHRLAFLTTAAISATERDGATDRIRQAYGWELDLYGIERLRAILAADGRAAVLQHPEIFHPALVTPPLPDLPKESVDCVLIDCVPEDEPFSVWLARRLMTEGYRVWCGALAFTGGESREAVLQRVMHEHAFRVLSVCSPRGIANADLSSRRGMALGLARARQRDFVIPLLLDGSAPAELDAGTQALAAIDFGVGWGLGLSQLLKALRSSECPRLLPDGAKLALRSFVPNNAIVERAETLYSNCLAVLHVPAVIHRFFASADLTREQVDLIREKWAIRFVPPRTLLAFQGPPSSLVEVGDLRAAGGSCWRDVDDIDGSRPSDVVTELVRRSIEHRAVERGLLRCPQTHLVYFPPKLLASERLTFTLPDGTRTFVAPTGTRKYWRPGHSSQYGYALAVEFGVRRDLAAEFTVLVRVRLRITDPDGALLPARTALSRRKHLCSDWWNDEWFKRLLAVCQFLADGLHEMTLDGVGEDRLRLKAEPPSWTVPVSIAEDALSPSLLDRVELLDRGDEEQEEEEAEPAGSEGLPGADDHD